MNGISTWAAAASNTFADDELNYIYTAQQGEFSFGVYATSDSFWLLSQWAGGGKVAFRMAYAPEGGLEVTETAEKEHGVIFRLRTIIGLFTVELSFPDPENNVFRYQTSFKPGTDLLIPFWPRDIVIPGNDGKPEGIAGQVHASQVGTRSGMVYFSLTRPKAGSVFYLQDLTSLNAYCEQVQASAGNTVGGQWPELGLLLPPTKDVPLKAGVAVVLSDAIVQLSKEVPADEAARSRQYLNMLAIAYLQLARPATNYQNWPKIVENGLQDLKDNTGCWSQFRSHEYFNAYVCDYKTPPEIMVQLAILLPLREYEEWNQDDHYFIKLIEEALPTFYDEKIGTVMRWLPSAEDALEEEEEQKKPKIMDAWYLHHPLLNLSRLALKGHKVARELFLNSLSFTIRVAHHFKYEWPVFYNMETLEVSKAETQPGKGGEKDVAGIYAHVMLQAFELTKDKKYLREAEKAAATLQGKGFDVFYQANNTTFSAGALLRLYKITNNELYLDLSYLCLAGVFKNVSLWDCNYGFGKHFPSFFSIFPLSDAPYTAAYEEQEVFSAMHDYLAHAEDIDILPSVRLLMSEFIRYMMDRAPFYYPPMLPKEMLSEEVKTGELDANLWIPLEDLHDGWEKSGEVGQEVYGAGIAFAVVPRHFLKVPAEEFMIGVDYPTQDFTCRKGAPIHFKVTGDERLGCRMVIVNNGKGKLPDFTVTLKGVRKTVTGKTTKAGHMEFELPGSAEVTIKWTRAKK
jgi:hypothetical protein